MNNIRVTNADLIALNKLQWIDELALTAPHLRAIAEELLEARKLKAEDASDITDKHLEDLIVLTSNDTYVHDALLELQGLRRLRAKLTADINVNNIMELLQRHKDEAEIPISANELSVILRTLLTARREIFSWRQRFKPAIATVPETLASIKTGHMATYPIGTAVLGDLSIDMGYAEMRNPAALECQAVETIMLTFVDSTIKDVDDQTRDTYKLVFMPMDGLLNIAAAALKADG